MTPGRVLALLYISVAVLLLVTCLDLFDRTPNSDAEIVLGYGMILLGLPTSFVLMLALQAAGYAAYSFSGTVMSITYQSLIVVWLIFFICGYVQWFVLVPWLLKSWRAKGRRRPNA